MKLTKHALARLQERGISVNELYEVLKSKGTVSRLSDKRAGVVVLTGKTAKGKRIRVVYAPKNGFILTAYRFTGKE